MGGWVQQKHRLRLQSAGGASDTEQSSAAREQRRPASGKHVSQSAVRRRLPSWQLLVAQHRELPITPSAVISCCSWHAAAMHQPTSGQHWVPCGCMLPLPAPPYRPRLARRDRRLRKRMYGISRQLGHKASTNMRIHRICRYRIPICILQRSAFTPPLASGNAL